MPETAPREPCLAQEWQRDGLGHWAMRACRYADGHDVRGQAHAFGAWILHAPPPGYAAGAQSVREEMRLRTGAQDDIAMRAREIAWNRGPWELAWEKGLHASQDIDRELLAQNIENVMRWAAWAEREALCGGEREV